METLDLREIHVDLDKARLIKCSLTKGQVIENLFFEIKQYLAVKKYVELILRSNFTLVARNVIINRRSSAETNEIIH